MSDSDPKEMKQTGRIELSPPPSRTRLSQRTRKSATVRPPARPGFPETAARTGLNRYSPLTPRRCNLVKNRRFLTNARQMYPGSYRDP